MSKLCNPLTQQEFDYPDEFIQSMIQSYQDIARRRFLVTSDEELWFAGLQPILNEVEKTRGTITFPGTDDVLKLTLRENIKYNKDPQGNPGLQVLAEKFGSFLEPMLRRDIKESGMKVTKFLEREDLSEEEQKMAKEIENYRFVTPGKPGVEIKARDDK